MKLSQLIHQVPYLLSGTVNHSQQEISALVTDSRNVIKDSFYVALEENPTKRFAYLQEAINLGATALLCPLEDREFQLKSDRISLFYTKNPRFQYALLSANWFKTKGLEMSLIGVTGTNGKTTITHMIKSMLEGLQGENTAKVGLIGTNENLIGSEQLESHRTTPDAYELHSLLRKMADSACTHVVMEVSSHGLVQHRTAGLEFDVGIFSNLTQDHLDYHETMEQYKEAKALLFTQCKKGVFNVDDVTGLDFASRNTCQTFTYGISDCAMLQGVRLQKNSRKIIFDCIYKEKQEIVPVYLYIPAAFSQSNALAALTCGVALGYPLEELAQTFPSIQGVKGRLEVVSAPCDFTVMIDYAHTPDALENVLKNLREVTTGNLICMFGCGGNRDKSKRAQMGEIAQNLADILIITSDNPRFEEPEDIIEDILKGISKTIPNKHEVYVIEQRKQGIFKALSLGKSGDIVLLAGKGHECYQEIKGERNFFDERLFVAEYFKKCSQKNRK